MDQHLEVIIALRDEFLQEAKSAPKLFRDLAKVEQYLAESYKNRSFIELIQNADDAQSTVFGVHSIDQGLIVANNGRPFSKEDVEALCRSGSSNKYRGGNTIGYRGIGFKSVVNLARRIYVFSGGFSFYFDKSATQKLLPDIPQVPLVRVPHLYVDADDQLSKTVLKFRNNSKYQTLFVFLDLNKRITNEEFLEFDKNSLIFLNNLNQVHFEFGNEKRFITTENRIKDNRHIIEISEAGEIDEWEILRSKDNSKDAIALKTRNDFIVPASPSKSVIHSFTPTTEFSGAYIKINGDYSTDPSRKHIDMDEFSQKSFNNALSIIVNNIIEILEGQMIRKGFFSPFVELKDIRGNRFRNLLLKEISHRLHQVTLKEFNGRQVKFSAIRLRPDWLNYEDYKNLCHSDLTYLSKELITLCPKLPLFLQELGFHKIYLEEIIHKINSTELSIIGAAQILAKIINQYRYDMTQERIMKLNTLKLFPTKDGFVNSQNAISTSRLNEKFLKYLTDNIESHDLKPFFRKLNIAIDSTLDETENGVKQILSENRQELQNSKMDPNLKVTPNIQKWRSAEKNAQEYLNCLEEVINVIDVSNANMGYDLEVLLKNRKRIYVEVKSVSSFSQPIKITNNEYASAHNYGTSYFIALVINEEPFQIKFIADPISNLSFQKQIERWSWICDSYSEHLKNISQFLV